MDACYEKEFNFLMKNNTQTLTPLPSNYNLVECKWVFKTKYVNNNEMLKRKLT
jgi:hypothetical protein